VSSFPTRASKGSICAANPQLLTIARRPETNAYTPCTSVGWVHVNEPLKLDPNGSCARLGTVGPNGGTTYTICTNLGWIDVNRPACADFPAWFDCAGNPKI
jgi:hypothetical protein